MQDEDLQLLFVIASFHLLSFGNQSLKMAEEILYTYIIYNMQLRVVYFILSHTKIFLWTKHTCLSTSINVAFICVCVYAPLLVCLLGRGAVELSSRSCMFTSILGKFYYSFSEGRLKRRQKNSFETKLSSVLLVLYCSIA